MITPAQISALLLIADKAIELHGFENDVREAKRTLDEAYLTHKRENGFGIERDSPAWDATMAATKNEFAAVGHTKRGAHNAKRRLETAIKAYLRGGAK
ncbi:hypothetical protein AB4156_16205 [Cupriavidus sp. 2MCAB6]|uniref:hypothetical protein n=1 Tax=Cupriavidus sp. 2MCAB6 TaxID=3232981 RepID=UPI003F9387AC